MPVGHIKNCETGLNRWLFEIWGLRGGRAKLRPCAWRYRSHIPFSFDDTNPDCPSAQQPVRPQTSENRRRTMASAHGYGVGRRERNVGLPPLVVWDAQPNGALCYAKRTRQRQDQPQVSVSTHVDQAARGGRSMRAGICPGKEESENCRTSLTASSTAVPETTGGGAAAPRQQPVQVPQPARS